MKHVFGKSASEIIYRFMERQAALEREEVGQHVELFYSYLEKLFGPEGTYTLRTACLKRLCTKLQHEYEEVEKYFSFLDELYEIKFRLLAPLLKREHLFGSDGFKSVTTTPCVYCLIRILKMYGYWDSDNDFV